MTLPNSLPSPIGGRLVSVDGRLLPLRSVEIDAYAAGGLAHVTLRQTFRNPYPDPLEVTYLVPLPADGAVVDFAFVLDGVRTEGRVATREEAREVFEQAILDGRSAALLEQDRSSVFRQALGNVPPFATVEMHLQIEQPLAWRAGQWEWRFPTVVAPRYLGVHTPDPERMQVDVADRDPAIPCTARIRIAEGRTGPASSPSHALHAPDGEVLTVEGTLDRDVVVRWGVTGDGPEVSMHTTRAGNEAFGLLTVVPASPARVADPVPRDLTLLLDTSGSMHGAPIAQLQAFCRALVAGLSDRDRLEMVEFSSRARRWCAQPTPMSEPARREARAWIDGLRAGGGTRMHDGIAAALTSMRAEATHQVVLVTDGLIGFEKEVVGRILRDLPPGCRVHTIGIGSGVNRSLTGPAARAGAGHEVVVAPDEPVEPVVAEVLAHTEAPAVVDLVVSGSAVLGQAPARVPDLLAGAPARVALQLRPEGGQVRVAGRTAHGTFVRQLSVPPVVETRRVVATRYARERVEDLELDIAAGASPEQVRPQIETLGLTHQIATRYTSWVALTDQPTVNPEAPGRHVNVPHALPHGTSAAGLGLRSPVLARRRVVAAPSLGTASPVVPPKGYKPGAKVSMRRRLAPPRGGAGRDDESVLGEVEEAAPATAPTLRVTVRRHEGGVLVLEGTVPFDVQWDRGADARAESDDGTEHPIAVAGGTRSGRIRAGQVLRVLVSWGGPLPARIWVGDVELRLA